MVVDWRTIEDDDDRDLSITYPVPCANVKPITVPLSCYGIEEHLFRTQGSAVL